MASSAKKQSDNGGPPQQGGTAKDSSHNPANQLFTYQTFTDALKAQKRHAFEVSPDVESSGLKPLNAYSTFIEAKERNSIIIDCAQFLGMEFKGKSILKILREQFPKCLGLKTRVIGKNRKKAIELGFSTENACRDALLKEFKINGTAIEVNKTLKHTANVINIGISEIPLMDEDELKTALIKAFESYGDILNIGISKSGDSDWFTGRGFTTLNRDKLKEDSYANKLTPQVELIGFPGTKLNLVWSQMKPICTDCHTDDHVKFDCPRRRRRLCHRCKSPEHLIAQCPTAPWNIKQVGETNKTKSSKSIPGSTKTEFRTVRRRSSGSREINMLDLLNQGQTQQPTVSNQFEVLADDEELKDSVDQEQSGEKDNGTATLPEEGVTMSRSNSEPIQTQQSKATPVTSTSTPRSSRSRQGMKLSEIEKPTKLITKRKLEDAISPDGQQASTPTSQHNHSVQIVARPSTNSATKGNDQQVELHYLSIYSG